MRILTWPTVFFIISLSPTHSYGVGLYSSGSLRRPFGLSSTSCLLLHFIRACDSAKECADTKTYEWRLMLFYAFMVVRACVLEAMETKATIETEGRGSSQLLPSVSHDLRPSDPMLPLGDWPRSLECTSSFNMASRKLSRASS